MKKNLSLFLFMITCISTCGCMIVEEPGDVSFSGYVYEKENNVPLSGASVSLYENGKSSDYITSTDGYYYVRVENVTCDSVIAVVRKYGYIDQDISLKMNDGVAPKWCGDNVKDVYMEKVPVN